MSGSAINVNGKTIPVHRVHVLVAGSGTASLATADRLHEMGVTDMAIVTEDLTGGTSRNTGSDKQTYYKVSSGAKAADSPYEMARALYSGGCMHGDIALVEALCSLEAFYHLLSIGVPFPRNRYGGVVGYKTDHDPKDRGTSIGPYTSQAMVERLLCEVRRRGISIYDKYDIVALLVEDGRAAGALCITHRALTTGSTALSFLWRTLRFSALAGPAASTRLRCIPRCIPEP